MLSKRYTLEKVIEAIGKNKSWSGVLKDIGLKCSGGSTRTMKNIALKNNINTSHFLGQRWNSGGKTTTNEISIEKSFIKNSNLSKGAIKRKILKYKLIDYKCCKCGLLGVWQNEPIVLHLDHVNGDIKDNRLDNLRFLCPNCHSQTPTYCRNSSKKGSVGKTKCVNCEKIIINNKTGYCGFCWRKKRIKICDLKVSRDDIVKMIKNKNMKKVCSEIGISINVLRRICREENIVIPNFRGKSQESVDLAVIRSRKFNVDKSELEKMVRVKSMCEIGRIFGVSDNAIRKRCRLLNISWK